MADKRQSVLAAQRWFELTPWQEMSEQFDPESRVYSKGGAVRKPFDPDGSHRRPHLDREDALLVEGITHSTARRLEEETGHRLWHADPEGQPGG